MKKYLFIFIALVLFSFGLQAAPAHAAITFVQSNGGSDVAGTTGVAFSTNVTAGDTLYASVYDGYEANDTLSISDSKGNTWHIATTTSQEGDGDTAMVACAPAGSTGADTVHFTFNGSGFELGDVLLYEAHGVTCGVDQMASLDNAGATTTCSSPQITTTNANDLVVNFCGAATHGVYSAGTGWSHLQNATSSSANDYDALEMQTSTATGNFTGKMTDGGTAGEQLGIIVAYASSTAAISNATSSPGILTAVVTWNTNLGADSLVNFGTSTTYTNSSTYNSSYVTAHSVTLTGLTPSTTYHYQVVSSDGLVATSSDYMFTTNNNNLVAGAGNIWVAVPFSNQLDEFSATGTYEGGFTVGIDNPVTLAIDPSGNLWVDNEEKVQEYSATGTTESVLFGSYGTTDGKFENSHGIAINSSGDILISDQGSNRIEEFSATGTYMSKFGSYGSSTGQFNIPEGLAFDSSGDLWAVDDGNDRVEEFIASGTTYAYHFQFGSYGTGNGYLYNPTGITFDASGNIWVVDASNNRLEEFSTAGAYENQTTGYTPSYGFADAVDANGNVWTADGNNVTIDEFSSTGTIEGAFGNAIFDGDEPTGIAIVGGAGTATGGTNISSSSSQHWAWNDAIGWMDFYDTHNIIVSATKLTGYASSSAGNISLDCTTSPGGNICGTSNYGVSNDGSGNLAGWAWNDTYGWISFCGNSSGGGSTLSGSTWVCPSSPTYQVVINPSTGVFSGWAWNDTLGWISFNCSNTSNCGTSQYDVVTTWTAAGVEATGTLDSATFDTGVTSGAQLNSVTWQGSAPSSTAVGFQFAVASSSSGPWNFVGPDGTSATTYTGIPGVPVPLTNYPVLNGRYFRYRAILSTDQTGSATPTVTGIQVNWSK
ncbi:MAG TPA: fibronectin type III domain-containing protein [Candidatus Paceibacterota bacterium]